MALCADGTLCAGTQEGVSIIRTVEMTLAEKAAYYQEIRKNTMCAATVSSQSVL